MIADRPPVVDHAVENALTRAKRIPGSHVMICQISSTAHLLEPRRAHGVIAVALGKFGARSSRRARVATIASICVQRCQSSESSRPEEARRLFDGTNARISDNFRQWPSKQVEKVLVAEAT